MHTFLPYLIVLIFSLSQIGFLLLLHRQQQTLNNLWGFLRTHHEYSSAQDTNYANLATALGRTLKDINKTLHTHDSMTNHYGGMTAVAEGALHTKLDTLIETMAINQRELLTIKTALVEEGKKTRKESQEIKTALRDDEKADQKIKRQDRAKRASK